MKAILDRKRAAAAVIGASRRWAASTAESLEELLRPELAESETMPDLELLQRLLGRALERRWRRLEAADQAWANADGRWRRLAGEQAEAVSTLYRRVVDVRRLLAGVFGAAATRRLLGLAGRTSSRPLVLLRQAGQVLDRLRDAASPPPATYRPSTRERRRWARPVIAAAKLLDSACRTISIAGKELEAAAAERRRAADAWNGAFVDVAGWLEAAYRAAGRPERAAAVRPSRRTPGVLLRHDVRRQVAPASAAEPAAPAAPASPTDRAPGVGPAQVQSVHAPELVACSAGAELSISSASGR